jgi:hypothetical protein
MSLRDLRTEEFEDGEWIITNESCDHFQTEYGHWTVTAQHNSDWSIPYKGELCHNEEGVIVDVGFHSLEEIQGSLITMLQIAEEGAW